jgi:hypothetical protein
MERMVQVSLGGKPRGLSAIPSIAIRFLAVGQDPENSLSTFSSETRMSEGDPNVKRLRSKWPRSSWLCAPLVTIGFTLLATAPASPQTGTSPWENAVSHHTFCDAGACAITRSGGQTERERVGSAGADTRHVGLLVFAPPAAEPILSRRELQNVSERKLQRKNRHIGRQERGPLLFSASSRPKSSCGPPALRHGSSCRVFFPR